MNRLTSRLIFCIAAVLLFVVTPLYAQNSTKIDDGTRVLLLDPCQARTKVYLAINVATDTKLFNAVASNKYYICHLTVIGPEGEKFSIVNGTGTKCATSTGAVYGGTTAVVESCVATGNGGYAIAQATTANSDLCIFVSGSGPYTGAIAVVVDPR